MDLDSAVVCKIQQKQTYLNICSAKNCYVMIGLNPDILIFTMKVSLWILLFIIVDNFSGFLIGNKAGMGKEATWVNPGTVTVHYAWPSGKCTTLKESCHQSTHYAKDLWTGRVSFCVELFYYRDRVVSNIYKRCKCQFRINFILALILSPQQFFQNFQVWLLTLWTLDVLCKET